MWAARSCLWLVLLCGARTAWAQTADAEVVVVDANVSSSVFEILQAALVRDGVDTRRAEQGAACSGKLSPQDGLRARVWVRWTKQLVRLCFQDRCESHERVLGPFAELDARAREEIITVTESGLAALEFQCPPAEAAAPAPETSAAAGSASPPEAKASSVASARPVAAVGVSEAAEPSQKKSTLSQLPDVVHSQPSKSAAQTDSSEQAVQLLLLSARYGLTRWTNRVVGQYLGAGVAYSVHPQPLFLGIEVNYAPSFRALQDDLGIDVSSLCVAMQLWARWTLAHSAVLDLQLGPALEWLSLTPSVQAGRALQGRRTVDHLDPYLFVRAGPALQVSKLFFVGVELQLDVSFFARSYGFYVGVAEREVFAPDRVRMSVALQARAEL